MKNYTKGTKALKKGKYTEAIDLLTLSINTEADANAYYNRGVAYLKLSDTCNFCNDMKIAAGMGDLGANLVYQENCTQMYVITEVPDSYREDYPNIEALEVVHHKCQADSVIKIVLEENIIDYDLFLSDSTIVYTVVEEMPDFDGGKEAMMRFISANINYPKEARIKQESGTVFVNFIIDLDGFPKNIKILKGVSPSIDQEAIRIVKAMPQWKPGKQRGKIVRVSYSMSIRFVLG